MKSTNCSKVNHGGLVVDERAKKYLYTPDIDSATYRLSRYDSRNFRTAAQFNAAN